MTASWTVIGSGTLVPSGERSSPCHLLEAGDRAVLFDLGPGAVHALARLGKPWRRVDHVVFTHYHADHFADLPHLLFALRWAPPAPRARPLGVFGPPGLEARVEGLRRAHGDWVVRPGFEVVYREVERRGHVSLPDVPATLLFLPTRHTDHSVAVRAQGEGWTAGYTGDAGPDPELGAFFQGVDLLVSECSQDDPPRVDTHLSCASVAEMAAAARPGTLALTHLYPPLEPDSAARAVRRVGHSGPTVCARDGQSFPLGTNAS